MKLFLPSARATNYLLIVGFCSLGYALYIRYLAIALFTYSVFGWAALAVAALNLLRPSLVLFAVALALACFGIVLYNIAMSALAFGLLMLSFARRAPAPD